jgi:hypothetical protein
MQDNFEHEESPDPLDGWETNMADVLIENSLMDIADDTLVGSSLLSLQEALEYTFSTRMHSGLPSEPVHYKVIQDQPDAHL